MSFGEVDTLNMLFDKLQNLFDESQGYYESFLDTNNMYKKGQLSDKEFFMNHFLIPITCTKKVS